MAPHAKPCNKIEKRICNGGNSRGKSRKLQSASVSGGADRQKQHCREGNVDLACSKQSMATKQQSLRAIPSVEKILQNVGETGLPRPLVVDTVREYLAELRKSGSVKGSAPTPLDDVVREVRRRLDELRALRIQPVINGTGILIHTNLGRAPLGSAVVETLEAIGANYNNLEFDLVSGERGGRAAYLERCLANLCGA
jgi:hypothetical protein